MEKIYQRRRQFVFLLLSSVFIGCMAMLNILGITKFIQLGPLTVAVGVLPYPLTFLCTDLLSDFFGKKRATHVVWVGLIVNVIVLGVVALAHYLPSAPLGSQPPWQTFGLSGSVFFPDGSEVSGQVEMFSMIYLTTMGAMLASMLAYLSAQFCDVWLFHFWKKKTKGDHLWLRNNGSTLVSQFVDSFMVISITFGAAFLKGAMPLKTIAVILFSNYAFKFIAGIIDTIPIYLFSAWLKSYLNIDPKEVS